MQSDLISREALLDIVGKMPLDWEYGKAVSDIYDIIKAAPAVDAAPVVHGRWIRGHDLLYCSECESEIFTNFDFDYCPNCGAKMDRKDDT